MKREMKLNKSCTLGERIEFLKSNYPTAAIFVLKFLDRQNEAEEFCEKCRLCLRDEEKHWLFVYGYLIPWF